MAAKRSTTKSARTSGKSAGKPAVVSSERARRTAARTPTSEELDVRDRLKSGPRRPAGPPLVGDVSTRSAIEALRTEVVPEPTNPRKRGGRK